MTPARPAPILPLALFLTVLLTAMWVALAWSDLERLRLPEADDMARLAQLRDWLGGQGFGDLVQARLGPLGGTAMHWSRLPDLVPGFVVLLLTPLMGATRAEIAAVIFWPELLFFCHLLLAGMIGRLLGGDRSAPVAVALAALAFPAVALFVPGRIDHHGLQIMMIELMTLGLVGRSLFLAGAAAGASLLIGIETAPLILAAMLVLGGLWVKDKRPIAGFGLGMLVAALLGFVALRPEVWPADRCDGFTPAVFAAMLIAGGGWLVLAGLAPRLPDVRWRAGAALLISLLALAASWVAAPACFASPYGLAGAVGEYGGVLAQHPGMILAFLGLPLTGFAAAAMFAWREPDRERWTIMAVLIGVSLIAAFIQLRGAWFAAALAAPVLAPMIGLTRDRGAVWQIAAWLISAGLIWQALGTWIGGPAMAKTSCADADTLQALDRLDTGTVAAPLELSAYILSGTQHRVIAGPYHRNHRGNQVTAQLFQSTPEEARYHASLWTIDYVALCPTPTGGLSPAMLRPKGLAAQLLTGNGPEWLEPVPLIGSDTLVWRVQRGAGPGMPR